MQKIINEIRIVNNPTVNLNFVQFVYKMVTLKVIRDADASDTVLSYIIFIKVEKDEDL